MLTNGELVRSSHLSVPSKSATIVPMEHNARVLSLGNKQEITEEMRRIGAEPGGIARMAPKAEHYLVKLENVRTPLAHILKESFLSAGGDAVVSKDVITAKITHTDVLLVGTRKHFNAVSDALKAQQFGGAALAGEMLAAIRNSGSKPSPLPPDVVASNTVRRLFETMVRRTLVMGILNVTPDSFSDGGKHLNHTTATDAAMQMVADGADIIDVGGESTRPGSEPVAEDEEIRRVVPVIESIRAASPIAISIDTYKAGVAKAALDAGADIINDISAMSFDLKMATLAASANAPVILMHIKGTPKEMQASPVYDDLMAEVSAFLRERIEAAKAAGVDERLLIIDPGFGFGKTVEHNLTLLRRLREFKSIGRPILMGTSRKSTIGRVLGDLPSGERLEGTAATVALSIANGANIVRVHDVKEMARVARMTDAVIGDTNAQEL